MPKNKQSGTNPFGKNPFGRNAPKLTRPRGMPKFKAFGLGSDERYRPPDDPDRMRASVVYQTLAQAIDGRRVVVGWYEADDESRDFCPVRIGTRNGAYYVEAYQIGGYTKSDLPADGDWRCFHLTSLRDLRLIEGDWRVGHRKTEETACFDDVVYPSPSAG